MHYKELNFRYWEERYSHGSTGWDIGGISTPLKEYIDSLSAKNLKILIPGAGNAYEAEYLIECGFENTFILDIARQPLLYFQKRNPDFPSSNLISGDFFKHSGEYDLILEQAFFCAIAPKQREAYVEKAFQLLGKGGRIAGLLWGQPMNDDTPPFGGCREEYLELFETKFDILVMDWCYNSIKPREGRELFFIAKKRL